MPRPIAELDEAEGGTLTCWDCQMFWELGKEIDAFFKHSCVVDSHEA